MTTEVTKELKGGITVQPKIVDEGVFLEPEELRKRFSFLSSLLNILNTIEAGKSDLELAQEVNELKSRFERAEHTLNQLPGLDLNRSQQESLLLDSQAKLKRKCDLIEKYQSLPIQSLAQNPTKGEDSYVPMEE